MAPTSWYVGFINREPMHWWDKLVPWSKYRHVLMFGYDGLNDTWIALEWHTKGVRIDLLKGYEVDHLIVGVKQAGEIIQIDPLDRKHIFPRLALSYCVAGAAHVVNLPGNPITPDGLFRALRKHGGQVAFENVRATLNKDQSDG